VRQFVFDFVNAFSSRKKSAGSAAAGSAGHSARIGHGFAIGGQKPSVAVAPFDRARRASLPCSSGDFQRALSAAVVE
jgi:hypothetical protein